MRNTLLLVLLVVLPLGCGGGHSGPPTVWPPGAPVNPDFPRLGIYASLSSWGFPFTQTFGGPLDPVTLDAWARHHQVIAHATPIIDARTDIVAELRARNPNISIIAYVMACNMWPGSGYDPSTYYAHYWKLLNDSSGPTPGPNAHYLYWQDGRTCEDAWMNLNLAERVSQNGVWTYPVAEALAELWHRDIASTGLVNGMFLDCYSTGIGWIETPANQFDFVRAGYATKAEFFEGWDAGASRLGNYLRELVGPNFVLIGNSGQPPASLHGSFNGWMRENFPWQNGGSWYSNMYRTPGGYFNDDRNLRQRPHNYLFTAADPPSDPYSAYNRQKMRLGFATAALGEGFAVFGDGSASTTATRFDLWWFDECAVNTTTGASSDQLADTGWLGRPTGTVRQHVWANPNPDLITNPGFETDLSPWEFHNFSPASIVRDTTTAGGGVASAKVHIDAPNVEWYVNLAWPNLAITAGQWYSISFRAKASAARSIAIGMYGPAWVYEQRNLTTGWRDYQVTFQATAAGTYALRFDLAAAAGDIWLDDIHLQTGTSNVFRRDFDRGIVLVNSDGIAKTVPLEGPYRKILGTVSPEVNDGATVTSVTLQPLDGIFLLND